MAAWWVTCGCLQVSEQELFMSDVEDDNALSAIDALCPILADFLIDDLDGWLESRCGLAVVPSRQSPLSLPPAAAPCAACALCQARCFAHRRRACTPVPPPRWSTGSPWRTRPCLAQCARRASSE
jgi:hypothetical protein